MSAAEPGPDMSAGLSRAQQFILLAVTALLAAAIVAAARRAVVSAAPVAGKPLSRQHVA